VLNIRRESIWIIAEILELATDGATTTLMARRLGLNYRTAERYVGRLVASGHLGKRLAAGDMLHELTEKGEHFLAGLKAIRLESEEVFSLARSSTLLAEAQVSPYYPSRDRRAFRAQLETRQ